MIDIGNIEATGFWVGNKKAAAAYVGSHVVWEDYVLTDEPLTFTAKSANSTVGIVANGEAPSLSLEYSTDGENWSDYTVGDTITLANIDDFVSLRATRDGNTAMGADAGNYNKFAITGTVEASGNANTILTSNKNETPTIGSYCYYSLFQDCAGLTTAPEFPSTTIGSYGYMNMLSGCSSISSLSIPDLKTVGTMGLRSMCSDCSALTYLDISGVTNVSFDRNEVLSCVSLKKVVADGLSANSYIASLCYSIGSSGSDDVSLLVRNWNPANTLRTTGSNPWMGQETPLPTIVSNPAYAYYDNNNATYYTTASSGGKYKSTYEYPCRNVVPTKVLALDFMVTLRNTTTYGFSSGIVLSLEKVGNAPDIHLEYAEGQRRTWTTYTPGTPIVSRTEGISPGASKTFSGRVYIRVP